MNISQKLGIVGATFVAFSQQVSPAKAVTVSAPYTPTLNANEGQTSKSNQVPSVADVLNNCNPNVTPSGTGGTSNGNTGKDITPGDNSHETVPEPTTMAGTSLAIAFGAWWKKKNPSKAGKNPTEVS
ncbi:MULTISPECIES: PEP-CTERM sorting domain-containing protein [unclassified Microcoleus]|uniref:PEP-CTERM sorting domain-containing protein n=1 Tax=unclassified Microcoleus TaxID=2642155 RepID=UPI002FD3B5F7